MLDSPGARKDNPVPNFWDLVIFIYPHKMCKCKLSECKNKRCPCFKLGAKCGDACGCENCANQVALPIKVPDDELRVMVDSLLEDVEVFKRPLVCVTWNMCHFTSFVGALARMTKLAFESIISTHNPDIIVLQEFPSSTEAHRIKLLKKITGDQYECMYNQEHVFIWKLRTIRPFKSPVDDYIHLLHTDPARPAGTMRLFHIPSGEVLIVSSIHLSSKRSSARTEMENVFANYEEKTCARFGEESKNHVHLLMGDVNLNPHKERGLIPEEWMVCGDAHTKTSVGGHGYDFVFINRSVSHRISASTYVLVQQRPKNATLSWTGISDHDPVILHLSFFRKDAFTKDDRKELQECH